MQVPHKTRCPTNRVPHKTKWITDPGAPPLTHISTHDSGGPSFREAKGWGIAPGAPFMRGFIAHGWGDDCSENYSF